MMTPTVLAELPALALLHEAVGDLPRSLCWETQNGHHSVQLTLTLTAQADGQVGQTLAITEPATERPARHLIEEGRIGLYVIQDGLIRFANDDLAQLFGFGSPSALIDRVSAADLIAPEVRFGMADRLLASAAEGGAGHFLATRANGSRFEAEIRAQACTLAGRPAVIGLLVSHNQRKRQARLAAEEAYFDPLTGFPNTLLLLERLGQMLARARRSEEIVALIMADIDHFSTVNLQCGERTGDQVLTIVANRLSGVLRASDSLARVGGDAFAVIAAGLTFGDDVMAIVDKMREALQRPIAVGGHTLRLGISLGIALFPQSASTAETLLRAADNALCTAKQKQRGAYVFFGNSCAGPVFSDLPGVDAGPDDQSGLPHP